ncbi:Capsular polysaccharide type 8 biosynthesis protein cap8A [uncultured Eubacterium sp.]|nr:Capsular polysaccharide type 8 biosynthesis protein cap8A [uncultured Eubacterium sp.]
MQEEQHYSDELEIDLKEIFLVLRAKIVVIIVTALIGAIAAGIFSFFIVEPMYSSTSKVYILTQSTSITSLADIQLGSSLTSDYMELIKSRPVVEKVIKNLDLDMNYEELLGELTVETPTDTRILKIIVKDHDPRMAMVIADEFASVSRKQISEIMKTEEPSIVEKAHLADQPVSPNKKMNILIGFLLGAFLSMLVIIVLHLMDDTIKTQDDVEKYLKLNTLAVIPMKAGEEKQKRARHRKQNKNVKRRGGKA